MIVADSHRHRIRRDGWTVDRQLRFLDELARTRSVTAAAAAAGMSRAGAHRFRLRCENALFAALWDQVIAPPPLGEGHNQPLYDNRLTFLLGLIFRRNRGDFRMVGAPGGG